MRKVFLFFFSFFFLLLFLLFPTQSFAQVFINEFSSYPSKDWIEFYRTENEDLALYEIKDEINQTKSLSFAICSANYCVVDWSSLNQGGDIIKLYLSSSPEEILDQVAYGTSGADVAAPGSNQSAGRCPDGSGNWGVIDENDVSKGSANPGALTPTPTPTSSPAPTSTPKPSSTPKLTSAPEFTTAPTPAPSTISYPSNIYLSEFMACPPSGEKEWVEIFNDNDFSVELKNWLIRDSTNSNKKEFSANLSGKSFYVVETSFLNNSGGDIVKLFSPEKEIESYFYSYCNENYSWSKVSGSWCRAEPSRGGQNNSCWSDLSSVPTPTPTPISKLTSTPTPKLSPTASASPSPTAVSPASEEEPLVFSGQIVSGSESEGEVLGETSREPEGKKNALVGGLIALGGGLVAFASFGKKGKRDALEFDTIEGNEGET